MRESKPSHQLVWLAVMWVCIFITLFGCYAEPTSRLQVLCMDGQDTLFFTDSASWARVPVVRPPVRSEWIIRVPTKESEWDNFNGQYKNADSYIFTGECSVKFLDDR